MKTCCGQGYKISGLATWTQSCQFCRRYRRARPWVLQISAEYRGHDGAKRLFENVAKGSEGAYFQEIHDVLAHDTHGVVLLYGRGQRSGGQSLDDY